ncbi:MAG TPA: hypothetical protein VGB03_03625 [Acidimicrobiales bacterium]
MGRSSALYLAFSSQPLVSFDGGRTFRTARQHSLAEAEPYWVNDLAAFPSGGGESAVIAQTTFGTRDGQFAPGAPIALTDDGGRSWRSSFVDLPGLSAAGAVTVTRSGRILAAGTHWGIACSADRGATWARTCRPGGLAG